MNPVHMSGFLTSGQPADRKFFDYAESYAGKMTLNRFIGKRLRSWIGLHLRPQSPTTRTKKLAFPADTPSRVSAGKARQILESVTKNRSVTSPSPEIALVTVIPEELRRGPDQGAPR